VSGRLRFSPRCWTGRITGQGELVHRICIHLHGLTFWISWLHTRGSALLGWVGRDAEHLAGVIDQNRSAQASSEVREAAAV
jgi:hypothetical protein